MYETPAFMPNVLLEFIVFVPKTLQRGCRNISKCFDLIPLMKVNILRFFHETQQLL
jgi:hypothetical protein